MTPTLSEAEVEQFQSDGFVVVPQAIDPEAVAAEVDAAFDRGFRQVGPQNVSEEAAIAFRYLPLMAESTPVSLDMLMRLAPLAEAALGGPVLPVRAKAVEYHGSSAWHRDSELPLPSLGIACYLEPLTGESGALRVVPGSQRDGREPAEAAEAGVAIETRPGDGIVFDERLLHASRGGTLRRQWRVDYLFAPTTPEEQAVARRYFGAMVSPDWDGGYDVAAFPTYGPHWRRTCDPAVDTALDTLGAYTASAAEEDAARHRARAARPR